MKPSPHYRAPWSSRRKFRPHSRGASRGNPKPEDSPRHGLARALSKFGYCSRSQAAALITAGRVRVNGAVRLDPEWPVNAERDRLEVDGQAVRPATKVYVMLNKPRGLITTASDEQGRETVFRCLHPLQLPHLSAVGRLDKASEGLLLFTNDSAWAARLTDPSAHVSKLYHVQVDEVTGEPLLEKIRQGVCVEGEILRVKRVSVLRTGQRNSWLEIELAEGRNRHIRRLLEALELNALRLIRVRIGPLELGGLAKGQARLLTPAEVSALT